MKSIVTDRTSIPRPGTFAPNRSMIPSSGWIRIASRFGSGSVDESRKSRCGTSLNWIAISDARFGSRFPVRRKNGTPDQRQSSTSKRAATNVSVSDSGSTSSSWR